MTDTAAPPAVASTTQEPTHREIVEVLVGLLSALFVAILSTTIVSTALPTIIADMEAAGTLDLLRRAGLEVALATDEEVGGTVAVGRLPTGARPGS